MVTIIKYNKITIDHDIYINFFSDGTVSYLIVFTDDVINTTKNKIEFPELTRVFEEQFEIKFQERSVLKYINFRILQSPLSFNVDKTDYTTELGNE